MSAPVLVTAVRFTAATDAQRRFGVLGYVTFTLNGAFAIDGVEVRRTADGRTTLSYAHRRGPSGICRYSFRPISDEARRAVEVQVFRALNLQPDALP